MTWTPEEKQKYIDELKASVQEQKSAEKDVTSSKAGKKILIAGCIVAAIAIMIGLVMPSFNGDSGTPATTPAPTPTGQPVPQSAIDEIYAISQDETVNKYIEVINTEDEPGYFKVTVEIKYVSEVISALEDAYSQAEIYTPTVAKSTVKILNKYGIDKDVSVWGRLIFSKDEIVLLGNTWYDAKLKSYNFERYKP